MSALVTWIMAAAWLITVLAYAALLLCLADADMPVSVAGGVS